MPSPASLSRVLCLGLGLALGAGAVCADGASARPGAPGLAAQGLAAQGLPVQELSSRAPAAQDPGETPEDPRTEAVRELLRASEEGPVDPEALRLGLESAPTGTARELVALVEEGVGPATGLALDRAGRERLDTALRAAARLQAARVEAARAGDDLAPWLRGAGLGLELLSGRTDEEALDLAAGVATPHPAADARSGLPVSSAFRALLAEALARDGRVADWVQGAYRGLPAELRTPVLRAMADEPCLGSLLALPHLLEVDPASDRSVLMALVKVAQAVRVPLDQGRLLRVRMLLVREEPHVREAAAQALGRLEDYESVPDLMRLLLDPGPGVSRAAHYALRHITAMELDAQFPLWESWYAEEVRWWSERAPLLLERLQVASNPELPELLRELGSKRLFRRQLEPYLLPLLDDRDPRVVEQTLAVVSSLRATGALPALVRLLDHPEPAVRARAHRTLQHLTGLDHAADSEAWHRLED